MKDYILLAVAANVLFAIGTQFFTHYTKKTTSAWMNAYKALVACILFFIVSGVSGFHSITLNTLLLLFVSGGIGLGIGDIFLLKAFQEMGPGRTMVLFGFQPLILGTMSFFFFDQSIDLIKFSAIILFFICIYIFSFEKRIATGKYDFQGIVFALIGMLLDSCGIILSRFAFNNSEVGTSEANAYRALGAVIFFIIYSRFVPINFLSIFKSFSSRSKFYVTLGAFFGTFASLYFYLMAVKIGHLASISAIAITSTIFASAFECFLEKKLPSKYLVVSFLFFSIGFYLMNIR